ncbi:bifunctional GNAT family N-acetyltransferase/carbon-nitrogen hydrolase family protein [Cohaesibacter celericrescens]|uniref:Carbon-nitrogen hydrolase n=1 Tax=Cohaesibacter celericrescens TaxID=2067669 RepID=A0A2N5XMF0_9HYPH|nr:bifunctional GNAT family N-acetyltransferase/carbon-nitrogen hydrolase family protein [Cohaesibacter celericrescens]PLW75706.1 carbon-nitrogen hydrolase [Cohaesibacter celericrescens]
MSQKIKNQKLFVRKATMDDLDGICALSTKVYGASEAYSKKMIRSQIARFPDGQFIALFGDQIVGHAATFIIDSKIATKPHTWKEITAGGYASRHNPNGDILYGMEVSVDPETRGLRIGQRLYNMRKKLCVAMKLRGIVFGGRLPGYAKQARKNGLAAEEYIEAVSAKKLKDNVLGFQLRNGFEIIGLLKNYLPSDTESMGYATHMQWHNALFAEDTTKQRRGRSIGSVRVACVQFQVRKVNSFEDFMKQVEYFVDIASDYKADFVVFPELFTLSLLSAENKKHTPDEAILDITKYTSRYVEAMNKMAISYNINIIGGSHPSLVGDRVRNISYVFLRGGEVHQQEKIHPTPNEKYWWNMEGGEDLNVIQTDCGPIGVLVCYDAEFPELARHLADQGALMLFVPFCTDERQGYLRVRYCSQARAIENQMYVATAGVVGNIPDVENMDIHYATSHIMTPCDFPFARDGIAAEASANTETIIFADLNLNDLHVARKQGSVQNFGDRRFDLYEVKWLK